MKRFTLCLCAALISFSAFAQSYTNQNFQKIAIVPFHLLGYPEADEIEEVQKNIEDALFHLQLPSEIISHKRTAAILNSKGINKENIHSHTIEDLAQLLGADAIIVGEVLGSTNGNPNMTNVVIQLVHGTNGQIVWKAAKDIVINMDKNEINDVMTASVTKFPKE